MLVVTKSVFHAIKLPGRSGGGAALITLPFPRIASPNTKGCGCPRRGFERVVFCCGRLRRPVNQCLFPAGQQHGEDNGKEPWPNQAL